MSPKVSDAHKENRRDQILEAAARCFGRKGFAATTMQEILQEAELSAGAVYSYFKGKLEIYMAIMDRDLEIDLRRYMDAVARTGTSWERLKRLVELYMANFADPAQAEFFRLYLLEFLPSSQANPELAEALRSRNERLHRLFCELLAEGASSGEFRPLSPEPVAALILAAGDGVRLHALTLGSLADAGTMYQTFLRNLETVVRPT